MAGLLGLRAEFRCDPFSSVGHRRSQFLKGSIVPHTLERNLELTCFHVQQFLLIKTTVSSRNGVELSHVHQAVAYHDMGLFRCEGGALRTKLVVVLIHNDACILQLFIWWETN